MLEIFFGDKFFEYAVSSNINAEKYLIYFTGRLKSTLFHSVPCKYSLFNKQVMGLYVLRLLYEMKIKFLIVPSFIVRTDIKTTFIFRTTTK